MYQDGFLKPRKGLLSRFKNFSVYWHIIALIPWILLVLAIDSFTTNENIEYFILELAMILVLYAVLQAILIRKVLKIFFFWIFTAFSGILIGLMYFFSFILSIEGIVYISAFITTSLTDIIGGWLSVLLTIIIIPLTASTILLLFTYVVWYRFVKPIVNSKKLNEKKKFVFEAIVTFSVALFVSLPICFILLIVFNSNLWIASFFSELLFSFITLSGFREIYVQNTFFNAFETKINQDNTTGLAQS